MCSVPVLTWGLKNELCCRCSVLVLAHGTTRIPDIPSESMCFQSSPRQKYCLHFRFHPMTRLPVTQVDSSGFISRLDSIGLQGLSTGI